MLPLGGGCGGDGALNNDTTENVMPLYQVTATVVGSKYLGEFEAETEEAAKEMALASDAVFISLCHQCSDQCENAECSEVVADEVEP